VTVFVGYLNYQVWCQEFSQCYDDVNICLWTSGSQLTWSAAQSACQQRNSSLPRITNSGIQTKLGELRTVAGHLLGNDSFWIDVRAVTVEADNNWHWIDGSSLDGQLIISL